VKTTKMLESRDQDYFRKPRGRKEDAEIVERSSKGSNYVEGERPKTRTVRVQRANNDGSVKINIPIPFAEYLGIKATDTLSIEAHQTDQRKVLILSKLELGA